MRCISVGTANAKAIVRSFLQIGGTKQLKNKTMLTWAIIFLVLAIIAGILGFGGIAGTAAGIAQILFFVFLALLIIAAIMRAVKGRNP